MSMLADWLGSPYVIPLVAVIVAPLAWVLVSAIGQWRKVRVAAYNARLKQLMIERGMSASEIRAVLQAGPDAEHETDEHC